MNKLELGKIYKWEHYLKGKVYFCLKHIDNEGIHWGPSFIPEINNYTSDGGIIYEIAKQLKEASLIEIEYYRLIERLYDQRPI